MPCSPRAHGLLTLATVLAVAGLALAAPAGAAPTDISVMSRNVYLGADLGAATRAGSLQGLVDQAGVILHQVDLNDFRVRAKGLGAEVLRHRADLVGLQEVALWRTGPCTENPLARKARHVRYDYLKLLLGRLNRGAKRYRVVVSQPEFDFEVYANTDGDRSTSAPGCPLGSEVNGRLTMRDVILAHRGRVATSHAVGGHFRTLLQERPAGLPVDVTRGWTRVDGRVGRTRFRFVNTHLEAFDSAPSNHTTTGRTVGNGEVREAQAKELLRSGGPAHSRLPVILVGDLNSDVRTELKPGDSLAYRAVLRAHFVERSASRPLGCCLETPILRTSGGGRVSDFDHKVDHVMTNAPARVRLVRAAVTGRRPVNGFWSSDHGGLDSVLRLLTRPVRFTG